MRAHMLSVWPGHVLMSAYRAIAGRSLSLLDPTYASKYIPIIASVSEHQPPSWPSYFTDLQVRPALPAGFAVSPSAVLPCTVGLYH